MKKIVKKAQPTELQQWRVETKKKTPENLCYGLVGFPTKAVLEALIVEQGYLCAYTLLKISTDKAHIEHLKPQSLCVNGEDVAWDNIVACFPQPGAQHPGFGAVQKDRWWDETLFISPLAENCESRFRYKSDGAIEPAIKNDSAAATTIDKLKLDCERLREARKSAIMKAGLHKRSEKPIKTESKVRSFIQNLSNRQGNSFVEFCIVLEHVGFDYIQDLIKRAQRKRYASAQRGN